MVKITEGPFGQVELLFAERLLSTRSQTRYWGSCFKAARKQSFAKRAGLLADSLTSSRSSFRGDSSL